MPTSQYSSPVLITKDGATQVLDRVALSASPNDTEYDEDWLQDLLFNHIETLPIAEIDQAFKNLVPICRELNTPVGPMDIVCATPEGKLAIIEVKLWRNPEARRKVVGQILDYAKEVCRWSYEDLQREVSRATKRKGNSLFEIVKETYPDADESTFVDEMSRTLREGKFLLVIVGDGIREGVGAIAEFLEHSATLHFTFGLVEMAIFNAPNEALVVQPRILAQTAIIKRSVVSLTDVSMVFEEDVDEADDTSDEITDLEKFYQAFWTEFLNELKLDDVGQALPRAGRNGNVGFGMPPSGNYAWVTVYFSQKEKTIGVFLTFRRGPVGDRIYHRLSEDQDAIEEELGVEVEWSSKDGKHRIIFRKKYPDLIDPKYRSDIKGWLAEQVNRFVNTFRPRLGRMSAED